MFENKINCSDLPFQGFKKPPTTVTLHSMVSIEMSSRCSNCNNRLRTISRGTGNHFCSDRCKNEFYNKLRKPKYQDTKKEIKISKIKQVIAKNKNNSAIDKLLLPSDFAEIDTIRNEHLKLHNGSLCFKIEDYYYAVYKCIHTNEELFIKLPEKCHSAEDSFINSVSKIYVTETDLEALRKSLLLRGRVVEAKYIEDLLKRRKHVKERKYTVR
jgi:hypothetical protein